MFGFLNRNKTPLGTDNLPLGRFVADYKWSSPLCIDDDDVMYIAEAHEVRCRAVVPDGPQGFLMFKLPESVKTREALLKYLQKKCDFRLKK